MPTLLTTRKMSPELRARVEASVRGKTRVARSRARGPTRVAVIRLVATTVIVGLVAWFVVFQRQAQAALEAERASLLVRVRKEGVGLSGKQRRLPEHVEAIFGRSVGPYAGDEVADAMRRPAVAASKLAEPMVYVRGALADFQGASRLAALAANSYADAFVQCLLDPPASRDQKQLVKRAREALAGTGRATHAPGVERLRDALLGLSFLSPSWEQRVRTADRLLELQQLRVRLEDAPMVAARRAATARLLLFVMDEPSDGSGPTELDGEAPHQVRVELRDLKTDELLFRLRRRVDPDWIDEALRIQFAMGIDSCALGIDVREELAAAPRAGN